MLRFLDGRQAINAIQAILLEGMTFLHYVKIMVMVSIYGDM